MRRVGRYVLHDEIASGGMATVHLGRILGDAGFARTVAIKRLHPHVATNEGALAMFMDEARLGARVQHRNIVTTLDVVLDGGELLLVMEYIHGVSLALLEQKVRRDGLRVPPAIASAIALDVLAGLEAVHVATDEAGKPLEIVHRDVSPQNILVGADGCARVLDFGIAKAAVRLQTTKNAELKGKLQYMAPEQLLDEPVDSRTDQFAAASVLWGMLTGRALFTGSNEGAIMAKVLEGVILPPSRIVPALGPTIDTVVLKALARPRDERYPSCRAMAAALREAIAPAGPEEIRSWFDALAADVLRARAERITAIEAGIGKDDDAHARADGGATREAGAPTQTKTLTLDPPRQGPEDALQGTTRSRARRRSAATLAGVLAILGVAGAAVAMSVSTRAEKDDTSKATPFVASASASTSTSTSEVPSESEGVSTASRASGDGTATTDAGAATKASALGGPAKNVRGQPPRHPKPPGASPSPCAQMYVVDANGIKRVKPECL